MKSAKTSCLIKDTLIVRDAKSFIVFSPFTGKITRIDKFPEPKSALYEQLSSIGFFQEAPPTIMRDNTWNSFSTLTLLTTRRCNLSCVYCSSSATPNGADMPIQLALNSVDWFLARLKHPNIRITFHGGGEPTLARQTIEAVVEHTEKNKQDKTTTYIITTNGTAEKDFLDWMMARRFGISISIDGPPDIQDRNRPLANGGKSSLFVEKSIRHLSIHNYPFSVRLTYSPLDDIEKIVCYLNELGVKKIHLEPLFPYGRLYQTVSFGCKSSQLIYSPESKEFLAKFLSALDIAKKFGIEIRNSHLINFRKGNGYFCGAASARAMVVTHDGFLTGCLEVVDIKDRDANAFILGKYNAESHDFEINHDMITAMQKRHADDLIQCRNCYARYNCAGGCAVKAVRATNNFFGRDVSYCNFTKALIPHLVKRIANISSV